MNSRTDHAAAIAATATPTISKGDRKVTLELSMFGRWVAEDRLTLRALHHGAAIWQRIGEAQLAMQADVPMNWRAIPQA
jgi:hypothetical protein